MVEQLQNVIVIFIQPQHLFFVLVSLCLSPCLSAPVSCSVSLCSSLCLSICLIRPSPSSLHLPLSFSFFLTLCPSVPVWPEDFVTHMQRCLLLEKWGEKTPLCRNQPWPTTVICCHQRCCTFDDNKWLLLVVLFLILILFFLLHQLLTSSSSAASASLPVCFHPLLVSPFKHTCATYALWSVNTFLLFCVNNDICVIVVYPFFYRLCLPFCEMCFRERQCV